MAPPYNKSTIVSVFVRIAKAQANPNDFLLNLLTGKFSIVANTNATVLTALTTGGSSANYTLPPNMSVMDILEIAELALRNIETGVDAAASTSNTGTTLFPPIAQVAPSERVMSYGQFGNIQR